MPDIQKWTLFVDPKSAVRMTDNERWIPAKDDDYLLQQGIKKNAKDIEAKKEKPTEINFYIKRKRRLKRYLDFKTALAWEAKRVGFQIPQKGGYFKFYLPMPRSWSKKKRKAHEFELHESKPDADNLMKAVMDALKKKDETISDFRVSKFWVDTPKGYIQVTVGELNEPIGYMQAKWESILI